MVVDDTSAIFPLPMRQPRIAWVILFAGLLVTMWAYFPGLRGGFYFDDQFSIAEAPAVHWKQLSLRSVWSAATAGRLPTRTIANLSFGLNHLLGGLEPRGYHWFNLALHLAVGLTLFWCCRLLAVQQPTGRTQPAAAPLTAALCVTLFLVHPLNIQAVTYVVQRMSSLAALFSLLSLGCYLRARGGGLRSVRMRRLLFATAAICWPLAFMSKENALILPAVVLAYEMCFHRAAWRARFASMDRSARKRSLLFAVAAAFAVVAVASAYVDYHAISLVSNFPQRDFNGWERVLTQPRVHFFYATLLVWPAPSRLNIDHEFAVSRSLLDPPSTLLSLIFWLAVGAGAVLLARSRPRYGFPLLAYFLFHFVESAPLNIELVFEHRMYLPLAALAILLATWIVDLGAKARAGLLLACAVTVVPLAAANHQRNMTWSDPLAFYRDCAEKSPGKYRPVYNYGRTLVVSGHYFEAVSVLREATRLGPRSSQARTELALAYYGMRLPDKAMTELQKAVKLNPDDGEATYNLAVLLEEAGRYAEAANLYRHFLSIAPPRMAAQRPRAQDRLRRLAKLAESEPVEPAPKVDPGPPHQSTDR